MLQLTWKTVDIAGKLCHGNSVQLAKDKGWKQMERIVSQLKEIADVKSPKYITGHPYEVFLALAEKNGEDKKIPAAVLYILTSGILDDMVERSDAAVLSEMIKKKCCLSKNMSDTLADIFSSFYSLENIREWSEKKNKGLKEFLNSDFSVNWEGFAVWRYSTGSISCHYNGTVTLAAEDEQVIKKEVAHLTDKNPFVTKEEISIYYERMLTQQLDREFDYYCTCEKYYEPVVEDFFMDDCVENWCRENGWRMIYCDGDGYDDGYEPDF